MYLYPFQRTSLGDRFADRARVLNRAADHLVERFLHHQPLPRLAAHHRVRRLLEVADLLRVDDEPLTVETCEGDHGNQAMESNDEVGTMDDEKHTGPSHRSSFLLHRSFSKCPRDSRI